MKNQSLHNQLNKQLKEANSRLQLAESNIEQYHKIFSFHADKLASLDQKSKAYADAKNLLCSLHDYGSYLDKNYFKIEKEVLKIENKILLEFDKKPKISLQDYVSLVKNASFLVHIWEDRNEAHNLSNQEEIRSISHLAKMVDYDLSNFKEHELMNEELSIEEIMPNFIWILKVFDDLGLSVKCQQEFVDKLKGELKKISGENHSKFSYLIEILLPFLKS